MPAEEEIPMSLITAARPSAVTPPVFSARSSKSETPSEPVDVVVFPAQAADRDEANQSLAQARELLGDGVSRELKAAGALKGTATPEQVEELREAGYQVVENRTVQLVRPMPGRLSRAIGKEPGWLRNDEGMKVVAKSFRGPFFPRPMPLKRYVVERRPEGPSDYVGDLPATGRGVGIAIIDSGIYPHPDLKDRLVGFASAVTTAYGGSVGPDPMGHGTHVAADAAGDGSLSGGRLRGPAPDAHLVGIQVLGSEDGSAELADVIENVASGIDWMVENKERYNIRVANISLGLPLLAERQGFFGPVALFDPLGASIDRAVRAGIAVVAAAGNSGDAPGTIEESPAINENVITVGALDTNGTPEDPRDDFVADFSSRGPTPDGRIKPDVLAPGVNIMAANSPGSAIELQNEMIVEMRDALAGASARELGALAEELVYAGMAPPDILYMPAADLRELLMEGLEPKESLGNLGQGAAYVAMDGTSMASPIVAGVVAAMLEANPALTPEQVKLILTRTADRLPGTRATDQGAGVVNGRRAVLTAQEVARRSLTSFS